MEANPVKLPPNFDIRGQSAAVDWKTWKCMFQDYLIGIRQDEAADRIKLSLLRNMMGPESSKVILSFKMSTKDSEDYKKVISEIEKYVNPRYNEVFERYKFNERKQEEGENFENFYTNLRQLLETCNYSGNNAPLEDQLLRDRIVQGVYDKSLQESLLRIESLTLDKAAQMCRAAEISKTQVKEMNPTIEIDAVKKQQEKSFKCRRCQTTHGLRQCPAYGKKCSKCGNLNHFAVSCRVRKIRTVSAKVQNNQLSSDSEDSIYCGCVKGTTVANKEDWVEEILIEKKHIKCRIDSGADVSVMPIKVFKKLETSLQLKPCNKSLEAFQGSKVTPVGMVNLHCRYKDYECYENFMVVDCNSMLLGLPASVSLNLIKRVHSVKVQDESGKEKFINDNIDVFQGHGRFPKKCSIPTVPHEQICHPAPRIPYSLHEPLRLELDRLVKRGAIIKVEEIESTACINRVVIVEKPNKKIRLCLDPSDLNKSIVRKPKTLLTLDEIAEKLQGKQLFSVFDLSEAFHCIPLTEESSWKCCFSTPFGVYRYLVLPYGLSNSPDLFQDQIEGYFGDIPDVITWFDDILIMGKTEQEHDETVSKVLKRAREINATFNKDKLQYKQKEVKYVGQIFSGKGMNIDKARVESLLKLQVPSSKEQLQKIIGSFNYVRRYVPEMAELMSPLCKLLKKDVEFQWLPLHDKVFSELKHRISCAPALCSFNPRKQIILQCDASQNGLGCCLFQNNEQNVLQLVACVSRTMNDCELNYSQTEKELLSIYFGTQKFHKYVYGSNIVVQTDHKPLLAIMSKPVSKVGSPRLRRLCLKLLNYNLELKYVPGKDIHFADMLSRNSLKVTESDPQMLEMVHSVSSYLPMSDERRKQFRLETNRDKTLVEISKYYYNGWPEENKIIKDCLPFYKLKNEIYLESGLVFLGNKIIVPESLKQYVLRLIHEGHCGISKCTKKARQLFYWPRLNEDIQKFIAQCRTCEKFSPSKSHEPLSPHNIPKGRYLKIGTDILELAGKSYLVIVDYFSHWLEIRPLVNKTSKCVIDAMQEVFTRFGYPLEIVADNNPFKSQECNEYYKSKDITIVTSSPHYPRSNGMAEKAVGISKNLMKKAAEEQVDYRDYVMNYNNTPLSGLLVSPSQILNSRRVRTKVPTNLNALEPKVEKDIYKLLQLKQLQTKKVHDRHVNRKETVFKEGDEIVFKTKRDDYWKKGVIVKKCKEPRSYWVQKHNCDRPFRRNTFHLKKSKTKINPIYNSFIDVELGNNNNQKTDLINPPKNVIDCNVEEPSAPPHQYHCTRSGRAVRPRQVLDL